jgi:hypothetical protein
MFDASLLKRVLFGKPLPFPNMAEASYEELPPDGLTMGTLVIGRQGTGKTSALATHIVDYFKKYPQRAIFVLDWSGSITDNILQLIEQEPKEIRERLIKRLVYDELGHPEIIVPMPEFSKAYGGGYEEQVQRVSTNLEKLAPELVKEAPFVAGLGLREIAPQIFRLLTAIRNDYDEPWQISEAKRLIVDGGLRHRAVHGFGQRVPEAKWMLEEVYDHLGKSEQELRTYAILALLGSIEPRETRARVGYYRPGWTPREAIQKGLMVIVNGARLINQKNTQHYLFTQAYSLIMQEINKRIPADPKDQPVAIVMDEVYSLLSIPGMAEEIGQLSPLYRSRKVELYIVLQALSQLAPTLREQIWSIGNIMCFALSNKEEAEEMGMQLLPYNPTKVKLSPRNPNQNPTSEPETGQDRSAADWIQGLGFRECIQRRYISERLPDKYIRHVEKTREHPAAAVEESVAELKERLQKERGILVRDALEVINKRELPKKEEKPKKV